MSEALSLALAHIAAESLLQRAEDLDDSAAYLERRIAGIESGECEERTPASKLDQRRRYARERAEELRWRAAEILPGHFERLGAVVEEQSAAARRRLGWGSLVDSGR